MLTRSIYCVAIVCCFATIGFGQCPSYTTTNTQSGTCNEPAGNQTYNGPGAITLTVNGDLTINGNLGNTETIIVNGTLTITGALNSGLGASITIANGGTINANSVGSGLGATFTVLSGGTLNVTNDMGTGLFAAFTVEAGGSVDVGGNFTTGGIGSTTIDGDMNVDGDFNNVAGGVVGGNGNLDVGGTYTNDGDDSGFNGDVNGAPLPVELVSISGRLESGKVRLEWLTASELNNEGFEINRSIDGINYEIIGFVNGNGTTSDAHYYEFIDSKPSNGLVYYQLRQVDFDGQSEQSPVVRVENYSTLNQLQVYPNPTQGAVRLSGEVHSFSLFDGQGRMQLQYENITKSESEVLLSDFLSSSNRGIYYLYPNNDRNSSIRIVKN